MFYRNHQHISNDYCFVVDINLSSFIIIVNTYFAFIFFFYACRTYAAEEQLVSLNLSAESVLNHLIYCHELPCIYIHKVDYRSAPRTFKMIVRAYIAVKMHRAVITRNLNRMSHINKQGKITVYCTKTYLRKLPADILIYDLCRRMILAAYKKCKNRVSLSAVLYCCHIITSFNSFNYFRIDNYYY